SAHSAPSPAKTAAAEPATTATSAPTAGTTVALTAIGPLGRLVAEIFIQGPGADHRIWFGRRTSRGLGGRSGADRDDGHENDGRQAKQCSVHRRSSGGR